MRGPALVAVAAVVLAAVVIVTRDPEEAWAVAVVIGAFAVAAGAIVALVLRRSPEPGGRRRAVGARRGVATRRGIEVGLVVALLLWLRVVDGLSAITGGFVIGAFVLAEALLSARPASSR